MGISQLTPTPCPLQWLPGIRMLGIQYRSFWRLEAPALFRTRSRQTSRHEREEEVIEPEGVIGLLDLPVLLGFGQVGEELFSGAR